MIVWVLAAALAGSQEQLARGFYALDRDRPQEAAAVATQLIAAFPDSVEAHALYIAARSELGEAAPVCHYYESWLAKAPDDPVRRLVLVRAMLAKEEGPGAWCERAEALLDGLTGEDVHRTGFLLHQECPGDPAEDLSKLVAGARDSRLHIEHKLLVEGFDSDVAVALEQIYEERPWEADVASLLWESGAEEVEEARGRALAVAEQLARSEDPLRVQAAWRLYGAAGALEAEHEALKRLESLDPFPAHQEDSWFATSLHQAKLHPTPEKQLAAVEALRPQTDAQRADRHLVRSQLLYDLGRFEPSYGAAKAAYEADPNHRTANLFAYVSALRGEGLDQALGAADFALAEARRRRWPLPAQSEEPMGWNTWREVQSSNVANVLDTRAWVLHKLSRHEEAAADLNEALLLARNGIFHAHLGFVYEALGEPERAFRHWVWAAAHEVGEPMLNKRLWKALEAGWAERSYPGSLEDWVAAVRRAELEETVAQSESHPLLGQPFPVVEFSLRGQPETLAAMPSPLIVDVWASWCGPCIESMPHLEALSKRTGVPVLGLSVDDSERAIKAFFKGSKAPWPIGWVGPGGMDQTSLTGIPAQFVLVNGTVRAFVSGWEGPDDGRLEASLAEVLD